jgi:hypothetical protein
MAHRVGAHGIVDGIEDAQDDIGVTPREEVGLRLPGCDLDGIVGGLWYRSQRRRAEILEVLAIRLEERVVPHHGHGVVPGRLPIPGGEVRRRLDEHIRYGACRVSRTSGGRREQIELVVVDRVIGIAGIRILAKTRALRRACEHPR